MNMQEHFVWKRERKSVMEIIHVCMCVCDRLIRLVDSYAQTFVQGLRNHLPRADSVC